MLITLSETLIIYKRKLVSEALLACNTHAHIHIFIIKVFTHIYLHSYLGFIASFPKESYFNIFSSFFLKILFIFFTQRGRKGEKERNINVWSPPTGDLAHNLGMWPEWESNLQPFGS